MDVVVVGAPDDDSDGVVVVWILRRVDVLEVGEGLQDGLPIAVVLSLEVVPGVEVGTVHCYYLCIRMHC